MRIQKRSIGYVSNLCNHLINLTFISDKSNCLFFPSKTKGCHHPSPPLATFPLPSHVEVSSTQSAAAPWCSATRVSALRARQLWRVDERSRSSKSSKLSRPKQNNPFKKTSLPRQEHVSIESSRWVVARAVLARPVKWRTETRDQWLSIRFGFEGFFVEDLFKSSQGWC